MPNESFLFASLQICSRPRPYGWYEWKLWWLEPGVVTRQKTLRTHMSGVSFLSLGPLPSSLISRQSPSGLCFGPSSFSSSGFQDLHICCPTCLEAFWALFAVAYPSGRSLSVSSSEGLSLTHPSVWFCALFSLRYSVLSRSCCSLYNLNFLHYFSPVPTSNPMHRRYTVSTSDWHEGRV